jgi:hypothetical protein
MKSFIRRSVITLTLSALSLAANAANYGSNLVVNGDAENGTTGWSTIADNALFSSVDYGSNWVLPSEPGPVSRGLNLFVGGSGFAYAAGTQTLDLSSFSADIAAGKVNYNLSGFLGGWTTQQDNAQFQATFLAANGDILGVAKLGPIMPADRNNTTGLFEFTTAGVLPTATAQVVFVLDMERLAGGDNDGYADNLSFVLNTTPVPEPESYALMLAGLAMISTIVRRRSLANH